MNGNSDTTDVVKTLVDSLTKTLLQLAIKFESVEKAVDRIEHQTAPTALLQAEMVRLRESMSELSSKMDALRDVKESLIQLLKRSEAHAIAVAAVEESMKPITRFSDMVRKPMAVALFLLAVVAAALAIKVLVVDIIEATHVKVHAVTNVAANVTATAQTNLPAGP